MIHRIIERNISRFFPSVTINPSFSLSRGISCAIKILQSVNFRKTADDFYQWGNKQITWSAESIKLDSVQVIDRSPQRTSSYISSGFIPSEEPISDEATFFNQQYVQDCCDQAGLLEHFLHRTRYLQPGRGSSIEGESQDRVRFKSGAIVTRIQVAKLCILGYLEKNSYVPDFLLLDRVVNGLTLRDLFFLFAQLTELTEQERSDLKNLVLSKEIECSDSVRKLSETIASHAKVLRDEPRFVEVFSDFPLPIETSPVCEQHLEEPI